MKNVTWQEEVEGATTLYTKPHAKLGQEESGRIYVTFSPDSFDLIGPFRMPDGETMYDLNIREINSQTPILEAVKTVRRDLEPVSAQTRKILRELAILLVPTLPDDLQMRGTRFSREQLLKALKKARHEPREIPGSGEKVSKGHRERR